MNPAVQVISKEVDNEEGYVKVNGMINKSDKLLLPFDIIELFAVQSNLGTYENFPVSNLDDSTKQMLKQLSNDMEQYYINLLKGRLSYISQNNAINTPLS